MTRRDRFLYRLSIGAIMVACGLAAAWGHAHADPIHLSRDQIHAIERMNRDVNAGMRGRNNCVVVAEAKYVTLLQMGIPQHAVHTVRFYAPGYATPFHQVAMVETLDGPLYLDTNSPWLETAKQARAMGYVAVDEREEWQRAFNSPE